MRKAVVRDEATGALLEAPLPVVREVLIDFGASALKSKTFTIADADVTANSVIMIGHSAKAATGRSQDENEMDTLLLRAAPGTGEFTLYADAFPNFVSGKFRVNYLLG